MNQNQRGITLIALVITIVVLIILAVISINAIFGENGILERAGNSEEFHRKGEATEEVDMAWLDVQTEKVLGELKSPVDRRLEELLKQKDPNATVTVNGEQLDIFYKDYDFIKETDRLEVVDARTMWKWNNNNNDTIDIFLYILDSNGNLRMKKETNKEGYRFTIKLDSIYDTEIVEELKGVKIKKLQGDENNTLVYAITQEGEIWSWGDNREAQCGVGSTEEYISTPTKLESITSKVKEIVDRNTIYALGEDGSLWTWGYNYCGRCGIGSTEEYVRTATRVDDITSKVKEVGDRYALGEDGSLWTWGDNGSGECGIGSSERDIRTATRVDAITSKVKEAGNNYAIGEDGSLWKWGSNNWGQCGIGSTESIIRTATRVEAITSKVKEAGYGYAIGEDGSLWTWGSNEYGECGIGSTESKVRTATRVDNITSKVKEAGEGYALGEDGSLWTWGSNEYGECGIGSTESAVRTATRVENMKDIIKIADFNLLLDTKNNICQLDNGLYKSTGEVYKRIIGNVIILEGGGVNGYISIPQ